jgi:hypothetical protein
LVGIARAGKAGELGDQLVADAIQDAAEMARRLKQWQALDDFSKEFFVNNITFFIGCFADGL